jgi:divalent metal cation (Fe/Co/Zn/Cd) transporter
VRSAEALIAAALPAQASFHALRTRKSGSRRFLEFHLTVPGAMTVTESHALCDAIETALESRLPRAAVTIHVEPRESQPVHR